MDKGFGASEVFIYRMGYSKVNAFGYRNVMMSSGGFNGVV